MKSLRHLVPTVVALTLAVTLSGCGKDSAPTAPQSLDQAPPAAPTQLVQMKNPAGDAWLLHWTPSTSPGVGGYEIYRYAPDPNRETAYVLVAQTNASTVNYTLPPVTQNIVAYYRIKSTTPAGVKSDWSEVAELNLTDPTAGGSPTFDTQDPLPRMLPKVK